MQDVVLELTWSAGRLSTSTKKKAFVGWTGMSSQVDHTGEAFLELDPTFAKTLDLEPRKKVNALVHLKSTTAHTVHLEPVSSSDWEIVELHAQYLEGRMLNQIRAVSTLHPITVYPSPTSSATFNVLKIEPPLPHDSPQFARLTTDTEVVIAPKVRKRPKAGERRNSTTKSTGTSSRRKRAEPTGPSVLLRGVSLPHPVYDDVEVGYAYEVYVHPESSYILQDAKYVNVSVVKPKALQKTKDGQVLPEEGYSPDDASGEVVFSAPKVIAKLVEYSEGFPNYVGLSYSLSEALKVSQQVGNIIRVELAPKPLINHPSTLIVRPFSTSSTPSSTLSSLKIGKASTQSASEKAQREETAKTKLIEKIKEKLVNVNILTGPITNKMILPPFEELLPNGGILELQRTEGWLVDGNKSIKVEMGAPLLRPESQIGATLDALVNPDARASKERQVVGISKVLDSINAMIRSGASVGGLLYGSRGSGKTAVLDTIEKGLKNDCIYSVRLSCGHKSEDPLQAVKEELNQIFIKASWYAPAVVILDDLDKLIPAEVEHADSSRTRQLSETFQQLVAFIMDSRPVVVLASCQAQESIHSHLITSHIFEETFHLKSPDKEIRHTILTEAVRNLGMELEENFDILEIASSCEGYQPGDLWTLVERAKHQAIIRKVEEFTGVPEKVNILMQADFDSALKDFVPSSLRGVKLQKSNVSWSEIGGLKETKRVLLETLEWPTRYAPIFSKCPLRLRSGLLLYGYPGCGKTLLASAVASESGLNFISIKGPEILNKYIGASEQSVRELFDRAQAAKPCILFFDEFDSIAPKRGHDSTGVTDRVVNQMLTQMDGAEGLDGVYVLAATSRPDLIDSALLRPGRLDKSLLCDMPSLEDRMDILQAVQGTMRLSPEVNLLEDVAMKTEGYSGADLQAVLYNAYLDAIHDIVDINEDAPEQAVEEDSAVDFFQVDPTQDESNSLMTSRKKLADRTKMSKKLDTLLSNVSSIDTKTSPTSSANDQVMIRPHHIVKSLQDTQPSISHNERMKLQRIYEEFVGDRSGDMPNGTASSEIGGRATLM